MAKNLAVLVLVLAMCPAASELLEVGLHMVRYGHLAHAGDDDHGQTSPNEEHGCSELFHRCACHNTITPLVRSVVVAVADTVPLPKVIHAPVDVLPGLDDPEPLLRPPISALM